MAGAPDTVGPGGLAERLMRDIEAGARDDRRARLVSAGAAAYGDADLFADVDALLRRAVRRDDRTALLPALLDADEWRLQPALRISSHRPVVGPAIVFVKRRLMMPLMRWLFDYSRENFRRQQRVNRILAACIEELAIENVRLRQELTRR
jgi:hypothetical protein